MEDALEGPEPPEVDLPRAGPMDLCYIEFTSEWLLLATGAAGLLHCHVPCLNIPCPVPTL